LLELQRTLRETEEIAVDDGLPRVEGVEARAHRDKERHEVIDGRMRVRKTWRASLVVEQRVDVAVRELLAGPVIELLGPRWRGRIGTEVAQERKPVRHET